MKISFFSFFFVVNWKSEGFILWEETWKWKKKSVSRKIIDCFRELAEEMDVQQITFQHLAKRLDIKAPSLYNHFKNIRDVKTALTAKLLQELNDQLRRALVGKSGQEALQIYAETYRSFAFSNQAVYELLISVPHQWSSFIRGNPWNEPDHFANLWGFSINEKKKKSTEAENYVVWSTAIFPCVFRILYKEPTIDPEDSYFGWSMTLSLLCLKQSDSLVSFSRCSLNDLFIRKFLQLSWKVTKMSLEKLKEGARVCIK